MSLRVISGLAKGRKLKTVPGDTTRPITDRAKEALFDILGADVLDSVWWDLFAGTGAVGIEALSRGAAFVLFTDRERDAVETIRANLEHCRLAEHAEVRRADAFQSLHSSHDRVFDYIYVAPPQYQGLWANAITALDATPHWLSAESWVIAQIDPREYTELALEHLVEFEQRKYGSTLLVFYEGRPRSAPST